MSRRRVWIAGAATVAAIGALAIDDIRAIAANGDNNAATAIRDSEAIAADGDDQTVTVIRGETK